MLVGDDEIGKGTGKEEDKLVGREERGGEEIESLYVCSM